MCYIKSNGQEDLRQRKTAAVCFAKYLVRNWRLGRSRVTATKFAGEPRVICVFVKYFSMLSETSNNLTYIMPNDDRLLFKDQDCTTVIH
jgi:hypothetical protein